jgi:hypothetical protein
MGLYLSYSAWIFLPCACVELLISPPAKQKVVVNYMTSTSDTTNTLLAFILYHVVESIYSAHTMILQQTSQALNFILHLLMN